MPDTRDANPFRGRPVEILPLPFKLSHEERLRGAVGVPAWVHRRKRLERHLDHLRQDLERRWSMTPPAAWPDLARTWDLEAINAEIGKFNRFYPIERDLPMDPRSRRMMDGEAPWSPRPPLDVGWILEQFPADKAGSRLQ